MDIKLFSQIIRELLILNKKVNLPELGTFITETVPAFLSNDGSVIYPPSKRVYFREHKEVENDKIFIKFYSEQKNIDNNEAEKIFTNFIKSLKIELNLKKTIELEGLGRLKISHDDDIYFIMDKSMDYYTESFVLQPLNLKQVESKPIEHKSLAFLQPESPVLSDELPLIPNPSTESSILPTESPEPEAGAQPEEQPEAVVQPEEQYKKPQKKNKRWLVTLIIIISLAILVGLAYAFLNSAVANKYLYTPEELEILGIE